MAFIIFTVILSILNRRLNTVLSKSYFNSEEAQNGFAADFPTAAGLRWPLLPDDRYHAIRGQCMLSNHISGKSQCYLANTCMEGKRLILTRSWAVFQQRYLRHHECFIIKLNANNFIQPFNNPAEFFSRDASNYFTQSPGGKRTDLTNFNP